MRPSARTGTATDASDVFGQVVSGLADNAESQTVLVTVLALDGRNF